LHANSCEFCVGTHGEIAGKELQADVLADWQDGRFGPRATAAAGFVDALTRNPQSLTAVDVQQARAAGVDDIALAEAVYVAFVFNTINRIADALGFAHRSDRDRRSGAALLRLSGYRAPKFLLR
jgi:alkylhydroperoxidase family enzyme